MPQSKSFYSIPPLKSRAFDFNQFPIHIWAAVSKAVTMSTSSFPTPFFTDNLTKALQDPGAFHIRQYFMVELKVECCVSYLRHPIKMHGMGPIKHNQRLSRVWVVSYFSTNFNRRKSPAIKYSPFTSGTLPFYMNRGFPAIHRECCI